MQGASNRGIGSIIGDYKNFFSDLWAQASAAGIAMDGVPGHLIYRSATTEDYTQTRDKLLPFCETYAEELFKGTPLSIVILREPLIFNRPLAEPRILGSGQEKINEETECTQAYMRIPSLFLTNAETKRQRFCKRSNEGLACSMIELIGPKASATHSGLDGVGLVLQNRLSAFIGSYKPLLTGIKGEGTASQQAYITFSNQKTLKWYDRSLQAIVQDQGWVFKQPNST